ncbi:hypothetical protein KC909_01600 [Candidatus Dojkabacteria bacterium]|uniref:Uncharacterized protein n=1 Tax=Candidatus Dojkabacteria bacterium TaxID=2099670 RepID=A0A955RIM0_9BACT|nr:hypothetical protein [Candidatus Dojkabacteria bacterium]
MSEIYTGFGEGVEEQAALNLADKLRPYAPELGIPSIPDITALQAAEMVEEAYSELAFRPDVLRVIPIGDEHDPSVLKMEMYSNAGVHAVVFHWGVPMVAPKDYVSTSRFPIVFQTSPFVDKRTAHDRAYDALVESLNQLLVYGGVNRNDITRLLLGTSTIEANEFPFLPALVTGELGLENAASLQALAACNSGGIMHELGLRDEVPGITISGGFEWMTSWVADGSGTFPADPVAVNVFANGGAFLMYEPGVTLSKLPIFIDHSQSYKSSGSVDVVTNPDLEAMGITGYTHDKWASLRAKTTYSSMIPHPDLVFPQVSEEGSSIMVPLPEPPDGIFADLSRGMELTRRMPHLPLPLAQYFAEQMRDQGYVSPDSPILAPSHIPTWKTHELITRRTSRLRLISPYTVIEGSPSAAATTVSLARNLHNGMLTENPEQPFLMISYGGGFSSTITPMKLGSI